MWKYEELTDGTFGWVRYPFNPPRIIIVARKCK